MLDMKKWRGGDPFLTAVKDISCPIFVIERTRAGQFQFVHLSAELQAASGLRAEDICAAPVDQVFPTRMAKIVKRNYQRALVSNEPIHLDETHRLNDRDTWWRTTLTRAPAGPMGHDRIIGITSEITDVREREAQLVADLADLKLAHKEVQMLAGLTAHDMRAPLANVISLTGIVLEGFRDLGDGKRDMIVACRDVAKSSIETIDGLIQRMVSVDNTPDREGRVDLGKTCNDIAGLVDPSGRLTINFPDSAVVTDPIVLHACLRNLLDNAVRFAQSRIDITLDDDINSRTILLTVSDDGPGVADGLDPIARATRCHGDGKGGYGLPTILRLIKSLGGSLIFLKQVPGQGATFRAELPGHILVEERQQKLV